MPNDTDDIELTEAEAKAHVAAHEKAHGHEMKVPPGQEKKNDVPTQDELDAPLPFVEPADLGEESTEGDDH